MLQTPVALLLFNRPELTRRVFERIRRAQPSKLLLIADGPRNAEELRLCEEVRSIAQDISWPCTVKTKFSRVNLGCRQNVADGLDWVFDECEEAIILEDDCLPDATFFPYCQQLLARYRDTTDVKHIAGMGGMPGRRTWCSESSYWFSRYNFIWGWATWRRAWLNYDRDLSAWPVRRESGWLYSVLQDRGAADYWRKVFDCAHQKQIDTWDFGWTFSCWEHNGLAVIPEVNLICNIGFGPGATHTLDSASTLANWSTKPIKFPLSHPSPAAWNPRRDSKVFAQVFGIPPQTFSRRTLSRIRSLIARNGFCAT